ncbi:MAG: hypothetical protein ACR2PL_16680, partial [Dehalococcoidia bacterium]
VHGACVAQVYGESALDAFGQANDLDVPVVLQSYYAQQAEDLAKRLEEEQKRRGEAQAKGRLTQKEREELERLRMEKKARERRARTRRQTQPPQKKRSRRNK